MGTLGRIFGKNKSIRLVEFIHNLCNTTKRGANYIRYNRRLARLIEDFEKTVHLEIYTDSFTSDIAEEYIHFIRSYKPEKKGHNAFRQSTIKNLKERTISALNTAEKQGYKVKIDGLTEIKIVDEDCGAVYLTAEEIERLNRLSLRKEQAQVRDLFLIGCCTALRYSDYSKLTEENFLGDVISVLTKKTSTKVTIPIHHIITDIIKRNKGYGFLNYTNSSQNFNLRIKTVCKKAGITDKILVERTEGFKKIRKIYKKYELISSHTARRSAATNMYLAGIPVFRIMLITGHKTEASFFQYIRIRKEENAKELKNHPFFTEKE